MNMLKSNESGHSLTVKIVLKGQYEYIQNPEFQNQTIGRFWQNPFIHSSCPKSTFELPLLLDPPSTLAHPKTIRSMLYIFRHIFYDNLLSFRPSQHKVQIF